MNLIRIQINKIQCKLNIFSSFFLFCKWLNFWSKLIQLNRFIYFDLVFHCVSLASGVSIFIAREAFFTVQGKNKFVLSVMNRNDQKIMAMLFVIYQSMLNKYTTLPPFIFSVCSVLIVLVAETQLVSTIFCLFVFEK